MPAPPTTQRMGEIHEEILAAANSGSRTKASGSQWDEQGDGRNHHDLPFAFRWDGKSTKTASITITLVMLAKIREQAHGERPQMGLLWYGNEALTKILESWILVTQADWEEVLPAARNWAALEAATGRDTLPGLLELIEMARQEGEREQADSVSRALEEARAELAVLHQEVDEARILIAEARTTIAHHKREVDRYRELATATQGLMIPPSGIPRFPWTVVHQVNLENRSEISGMHYDATGHMSTFTVNEVHVERSPDSLNRPRLIVNNVWVPAGDLYVDGKRVARGWSDNPSAEEG